MAFFDLMSTAIENDIFEFSIVVPLPGQDVARMGCGTAIEQMSMRLLVEGRKQIGWDRVPRRVHSEFGENRFRFQGRFRWFLPFPFVFRSLQ